MGRPKRGGVRTATPGASYVNRTDLASREPVFKGQPYGTLPQQQAMAQAGQQAAQNSPPAAGPLFGGQHPVPPGVPAPGEFPDLFAPTDRPDEPVTHGLPFGPGADSIPQPFKPDPVVQASALLSSLPSVHQTPALKALSAALQASTANGTQTGIVQ